jgi:hypothetical protein
MLDNIATLIGFFGAALIGFAVIGGTNRPRAVAIIGTALVVVTFVLLLLVAIGVARA